MKVKPPKREVVDEESDLRHWADSIMVATGKPGCGKTKWALMTAHLKDAAVIVREDNFEHTISMGRIYDPVIPVFTYGELRKCTATPPRVVLDDYLKAFARGEVRSIQELETLGKVNMKVVAVTFVSRQVDKKRIT